MRTEVVADAIAHEGEFQVSPFTVFDVGAKFPDRSHILGLLSFQSLGRVSRD